MYLNAILPQIPLLASSGLILGIVKIETLTSWLLSKGIKLAIILAAAYLANRFLEFFIEKGVKKRIKDGIDGAKRKRVETILSVLDGTLRFIIWVVVLLMILSDFGVNISPLLASLGVAGLAVGMAARDIISDFIAGLFILLEEQYNVGDSVTIAGLEGRVEEITLRKTTIKDKNGVFHLIPNSQIKIVSKASQ